MVATHGARSEHDQTVVNQNDEFLLSPQASTSFLQGSKRKCPTLYSKNNLGEKIEFYQEVYEMPQDIVINSPAYSPILPHFPRVPSRIMGKFTVNILRQRYDFVDSQGTTIDLIQGI